MNIYMFEMNLPCKMSEPLYVVVGPTWNTHVAHSMRWDEIKLKVTKTTRRHIFMLQYTGIINRVYS